MENADSDIVWSTSDKKIATVDDGIVYGVDVGTAIITATVGETKASCTVTVAAQEGGGGMEEIPVLHFELSAECVWVGYSFAPSATLKVKNVPVTAEITFVSSNTSVAKIENGQIVALSVGETTITASCTYQGGLYQKIVTLEAAMDIFSVLTLLGGLAFFLYGVASIAIGIFIFLASAIEASTNLSPPQTSNKKAPIIINIAKNISINNPLFKY